MVPFVCVARIDEIGIVATLGPIVEPVAGHR